MAACLSLKLQGVGSNPTGTTIYRYKHLYMTRKPEIGSPEWETQIIESIATHINALLLERKDMRALALSKILDEFKIYFKQKNDEGKNNV